MPDETALRNFDPLTFQILWSRAITIADEMSATLVRTAFSSVVRDNHDYAVAIYDAGGRMLAQSNQCTPGQLGAMPLFVADCLKQYPAETLEPGDVLITNDPWVGSGHTPDIYLATPLFRDGNLAGFAANSAHHIDNISISTDVQQIPGLVAHYPFDETSGVFTLLDISGNGHHATTSGVDTGVAGFDGNAVRFDQVDDSVLIPSIPDAIGDMTPDTEMTVSLWVKEENFFADNEQRSLFTVRNGTGNEIQFLWDRTPAGAGPDNDGFKVVQFETIGGAFAGTFVTGGRVEGSGTPLGFGDGEWHHVVFERRGTMTHIYVDGKPKAWGPTVVGPQLAGGEAAIGNSIQTLVQAMNGSIDDVQIYDYGIGEDAVEWLFQNPGEPFDINDCNGDGVVDIQDVNCACEAGDTDLADAIIIAIGSIVGDADGNGTVDFPDFVRLSNNFQEPGQYTDGDFNWDGTVTFLDFVLLSNNFGSSGGGSGTFDSPEPTSLGLLGLGGLLLGRALRGSRNGAKAQRK